MDEFGRKTCDLEGYAGVWVKFKTSGYPFRLRAEWTAAPDDESAMNLLLPYVVEWNIKDMKGEEVKLTTERKASPLLDNVEDRLAVWIIGAFVQFWRRELPYPQKNSSPPSTETS